MAVGLLVLATIQLIKQDYRRQISSSASANKTEVFVDMVSNSETTTELQNEKQANNLNTRLNQGWIISKIYERIPKKKDYACCDITENRPICK